MQSRQVSSYISRDSKMYHHIVQNEQKHDHFNSGLRKEADMGASAKKTNEMHNDYNNYFQELGVSSRIFIAG